MDGHSATIVIKIFVLSIFKFYTGFTVIDDEEDGQTLWINVAYTIITLAPSSEKQILVKKLQLFLDTSPHLIMDM